MFSSRFFPLDNNKYKNGNALAGTVVDQGINHPTEGDFYLLRCEKLELFHIKKLHLISTATRASRGPQDLATTMCCGTTVTSAPTSWRFSPTTSATSTPAAPGLISSTALLAYLHDTPNTGQSPTRPQPTTPTWWLTAPGSTTTSWQQRMAEVLAAPAATHMSSRTSRRGTSRSWWRLQFTNPCTLYRSALISLK